MTFDELGLAPRLAAALTREGLTEPTLIQTKAIPHALAGRDVMGLAQTGTGKTLAFGLPLLQGLLSKNDGPAPKTARALVLAPTRELARQIQAALVPYTKGTSLSVSLVVGGGSISAQIGKLRRGTDVLVATPGRLIDLLDRKAVRLDQTRALVLDEADQMLDMGFIHALRRIAKLLPADRQTMLFSATMPKLMAELSAAFLRDPVRVEAAPAGKVADRVAQAMHFVEKSDKTGLLIDLLDGDREARSVVFARTKHGAERLMKQVSRAGFAAASLHGNKTQGQRNRALDGFRSGETRVLVATDVAARGIDIPGVTHVYNFDLPNVPETYVHRIGRTARAGAGGQAVAFCAPEEMGELRAILGILDGDIETAGGTPWGPLTKPDRKGNAGKPGTNRRRRRNRGGRAKAAA